MLLLVVGGLLLGALFHRQFGLPGVVIASLGFFLVGRLAGYFYRDFFRGLRALHRGDAAQARTFLERFRAQLQRHPWLKSLITLTFVRHTTDIRAMTLYNLALSCLLLKENDEARSFLDAALEIDPKYCMPWVGRWLLATARGDEEAARGFLEQAVALGYRGSSNHLAQLYAWLEGFPGLPGALSEQDPSPFPDYHVRSNSSTRALTSSTRLLW